MVDEELLEWERLMKGAFAGMTAPFAVHPADRERAKRSVTLAGQSGVTLEEYVSAAQRHLDTVQGWPTDVNKQLTSVRNFADSVEKLPLASGVKL